MNNPIKENTVEDTPDETVTYAEIIASALLNPEVVITVPMEEEERVKNGIKNYKSKQITKQKEEGLPIDTSTLSFYSIPSKEFEGCVDISIIIKQRGSFQVKSIRYPENEIPD